MTQRYFAILFGGFIRDFFRKKSVESHLLFAAAFEMNVERAPEVDYVE